MANLWSYGLTSEDLRRGRDSNPHVPKDSSFPIQAILASGFNSRPNSRLVEQNHSPYPRHKVREGFEPSHMRVAAACLNRLATAPKPPMGIAPMSGSYRLPAFLLSYGGIWTRRDLPPLAFWVAKPDTLLLSYEPMG